MHLLETYALSMGSKINKPFILPKYFPMSVDKYITVHFNSKDAKSYDHAQEVVNILHPYLSKLNISLVQIGTANDQKLNGCYITLGQTNINNVAYIIKNSLLHLGVDSFPVHVASFFDKPIVALYSTNFIESCGPYWGNKDNQILLEPKRGYGIKPSFSNNENPKTINTISPELIASSVCTLLNIDFSYKFKTLLLGDSYKNQILETIPNQVINVKDFGIDNIIVRMDLEFNEINLQEQLNLNKCIIITNKSINSRIIESFKQNIQEIIYIIEEDNDPKFIKYLQKSNIKYVLISYLNKDILSKYKINYMDYGLIFEKTTIIPEIINNIDPSLLYFKSSKYTLSQGKMFPSHCSYKNNKDIVSGFSYDPIPMKDYIKDNLFWKDLEYFNILVKK